MTQEGEFFMLHGLTKEPEGADEDHEYWFVKCEGAPRARQVKVPFHDPVLTCPVCKLSTDKEAFLHLQSGVEEKCRG